MDEISRSMTVRVLYVSTHAAEPRITPEKTRRSLEG